jgi:hypothetical protein
MSIFNKLDGGSSNESQIKKVVEDPEEVTEEDFTKVEEPDFGEDV